MVNNPEKNNRQLSSEVMFSNPWWEYRKDEYLLPNGKTGEYHYVNSRGACMVIPRLENNTFVMVRQYRYLNRRISVEFPGGGVSEGYSPIENAKKELQEESGYIAGEIKEIGLNNPYNGVTNEICSVFLAEKLTKKEIPHDETEEFEIIFCSEEEINNMIINGEIWDGMTLAAWSIYFANKIGGKL